MKIDLPEEDWHLVIMHLVNYADMVKHSEANAQLDEVLERTARELATRIAEQTENK